MSLPKRYGPWALVLGASEGTGREFARQLAAEGIPSILIARREAPLEQLKAEIAQEYGVACINATIDLAHGDALERIVAVVDDREVGLLICNAGGDPNGKVFLDVPLSAWLDLIQRNVMTTMAVCHHFAGPMRTRGQGGILLLNSGACYGGAATMGPYSGSKAFMLGFAEGLWADLQPHGVDVLTLVLGRTDTPEFRRFLAEKGMDMPEDVWSAEAVARLGLERLPHGPIQNVGQADDQSGMSPQSAAERRARVVAVSKVTAELYGTGH
ncbi:SDR family NAD(P)-dependent oxidoreductase [Sphingobium sp. AP49]|uniref:SDR family NAD(P)-dependent oxidoreductase n=1 Tax=Sphingobium sp. AP49 TaxID=1144307 RepID=UPI00026EDAC8|nr:SDR family NAD(P)-dependent oxidoreductase [Sphingobium sp. AP49]WHO38871.1 SDR family NAD(P)-dependent oxidoreductase [Sphingobium sp. AP49]